MQQVRVHTPPSSRANIQPHCVPHILHFDSGCLQAAALSEAKLLQEEMLRCEAEAAAQLAAESARRAQAEEAVEQYIAAHYASQAAAQVPLQ